MIDLFQRPVIDSFRGEYAFLSNFYPYPIYYEGETWPTSEHAYQASKCFYDEDYAKFLNPKMTPGQAKRLGQKVLKWERWDEIRLVVMEGVLRSKFERDTDIAWKLLKTDNACLIEGNHHGDRFWGQVDGVGENYLGRILERIREDLKWTMTLR